jgi:GDP-L-fucose synthase
VSRFWDNKRILVTGGQGFLGSHLLDRLENRGVSPEQISAPRSDESDFRTWPDCLRDTKDKDLVIHLAARVGGIGFNRSNPGLIFYDNMMMGAQLVEASRVNGVDKFVMAGTVCAYPKFTPVPFMEEDLWNGYPEETNAPYGVAKKAVAVQLAAYREQYGLNGVFVLPANLYGPRDNFDLESSHVIPALIRKCVEAQERGEPQLPVWGTGTPTREFLYVDDAAEGILCAAERYDSSEPVNLGTGEETSIKELVETIVSVTGFDGEIVWQTDKPDGQPRRKLDTEKARDRFGFEARTSLRDGLERTVAWYREHREVTAN